MKKEGNKENTKIQKYKNTKIRKYENFPNLTRKDPHRNKSRISKRVPTTAGNDKQVPPLAVTVCGESCENSMEASAGEEGGKKVLKQVKVFLHAAFNITS